MALNVDTMLKLSLAAGALLAGAGVGYYYGIFLPAESIHQTLDAGQQQEAAASDRRAAFERARAAETKRREAARQHYETCLAAADTAYQARWTSGCRTQHVRQRAAFEDCADDWFRSRKSCAREFPVEPERGCVLPAPIGNRFALERDAARAQCLGGFQSGI
ncbi:hypothetical protein ABVV53_01325 [Novosphingobium sp. RD2P27]|uniref:Uncharacterized protein n=1 Tax=Novosphingobium kalidii TaxID=3230299 RepID=A0ABV2CWY4_9SPHN